MSGLDRMSTGLIVAVTLPSCNTYLGVFAAWNYWSWIVRLSCVIGR